MEPKTWDRGIDFLKWHKRLLEDLNRFRKERNIRSQRRFTYTSILLVQLRNGCRISEAYKAFKSFVYNGEREVNLKAGKRGDLRLIVIPKEIYNKDKHVYRHILNESDEKRFLDRLKQYARRYYGINTHSLRYALIGFLAEKGVAAQLVAKITGHKKLSRILDYTQKVKAEKLLKELDTLF